MLKDLLKITVIESLTRSSFAIDEASHTAGFFVGNRLRLVMDIIRSRVPDSFEVHFQYMLPIFWTKYMSDENAD